MFFDKEKIKEYDEIYCKKTEEQENIKKKHKDELPYLKWNDFVRLMRHLPSQSYSTLIERRIRANIGYKNREKIGDGIDKRGVSFEIKCSIRRGKTVLSIKQVRPHEKVDSYIIVDIYIDIDDAILTNIYDIPAKKMVEIAKEQNSLTHGKKRDAHKTQIPEYTVRYTKERDRHNVSYSLEDYTKNQPQQPDLFED